jgi:pyruvate/2-oxoglutarate dehydrogenase complex dihydrolipoamide dehydrogenase (E3) component/uncharacterized membrane protein YdjX (TVP38/TMEM64 family)
VKRARLFAALALAAAIAAFFAFDLGRFFTLDFLKAQQAAIDAQVQARPLFTAALFFAAYVAVTGLSLPGAAIMTLAGGAVFGLLWGTVIVSFASSVGATVGMLASRFLFRDAVQARFGNALAAIDRGMARDGAFYLFTLRLVPVMPFFVVNLLMGLTRIRVGTFYWVSQAGMLLGTIAYVNAGTQLARIDGLGGILSPAVLASFAALGLLPLVAKKVVDGAKARRIYARWPRPARFDRNLVVIGAGSAGLVSAYIAAAVKAKVTLVEKHRMGGDCLNTGCVPSKALIRSARLMADIRRAADFGIAASGEARFRDVMARVRRVIADIEPHDSVDRYTSLGVECLAGEARIVSPWAVEIRGADGAVRTLTTRGIVIAAGARPFVPPIPGLEDAGYLTSDTVWSLDALPPRLLVLGGGPIGCELAQAFARLGAAVTQVEQAPRLMTREDPEFAELVSRRLRDDGVDVRTGHTALRVEREGDAKVLVAGHAGGEVRLPFDQVLVAVGRVANTAGYGLEALGIPVTPQRTVEVDEFMRTPFPNVYACGDVAGPFQFTHTAAHTAWYAAVNALFDRVRRFRADFSVVPWATFTAPEVARVGLNETEAKAKGIAYEVTTYGIDDLDRAIADGEAYGMIKVLTVPGRDRILGVTIAAAHAADLLAEYVLAMRHGIGLDGVLRTIHVYPTFAEANKYAAGNWKRAQVTRGQTAFLDAWHAWTRGERSLAAVLGRLPGLATDRRRAAATPAASESRH